MFNCFSFLIQFNMPIDNCPLNKDEFTEYKALRVRYAKAGGNPDDPFEETTLPGLYRHEYNEQPDNRITPDQIGRLRELFCRLTDAVQE